MRFSQLYRSWFPERTAAVHLLSHSGWHPPGGDTGLLCLFSHQMPSHRASGNPGCLPRKCLNKLRGSCVFLKAGAVLPGKDFAAGDGILFQLHWFSCPPQILTIKNGLSMRFAPFGEGSKHNRPVAPLTPHCAGAHIHTRFHGNSNRYLPDHIFNHRPNLLSSFNAFSCNLSGKTV